MTTHQAILDTCVSQLEQSVDSLHDINTELSYSASQMSRLKTILAVDSQYTLRPSIEVELAEQQLLRDIKPRIHLLMMRAEYHLEQLDAKDRMLSKQLSEEKEASSGSSIPENLITELRDLEAEKQKLLGRTNN